MSLVVTTMRHELCLGTQVPDERCEGGVIWISFRPCLKGPGDGNAGIIAVAVVIPSVLLAALLILCAIMVARIHR